MKNHAPNFKSAKGEAEFLTAYDNAMKLWPVPYIERDIPTKYGSTHVIISGPDDGPPLVMLHCALMTSAVWSPAVDRFSSYYRTYAVDVMGDVGRTVPDKPPQTLQEYAHWLAETFDGLGIERARLLGWSFGGFIAANFAIHEPRRVEKLVLLAPFLTFIKAGPAFLLGFLPVILPVRPVVRFFERLLCYKRDFGCPEHSEILCQRFKNGRMVFKTAPKVFTDEELRRLTMPVLLLVGDHEVLYNSKAAIKRAEKAVPGIDAELVRDCNHAMISDRTVEVVNRIMDFLEE